MIPDNKKSFLWLTENYPPSRGGMAQSCDRIVQGLREKGFQIHVFHFTNRKKSFAVEKKINGSCTALPVFESESHTLNIAWNHINEIVDKVHEIVLFGGYLPLIGGPVFSVWSGKPLITLLRGNDFDISVFSPRRKVLLNEAVLQAKAVGVITKDKVIKVKKLYPNANVYYTPNGICVDDWNYSRSDLAFSQRWRKDNLQNRICVGIIGQLKEKKGIDVLIETMRNRFLKEQYFLLMIGEIEEEYRVDLVESGIEHQILPFMDRYELLKYYAVCDTVAIPSHYDGMPNVLLEAGALGIPVIGSNIDGMKDMIEHEKSGLIFRTGAKSECRDTLVRFAGMSEEDRKNMGENLRKKVYEEFNHTREIENYYKILSDEYKPGVLV